MAKPQTLKADERARTGSGVLKQMRREGFVPSVVYGGGTENKNVKIDAKTLRDMLANAASDSILVNLDIEGGKTQLAFLQDVQHNALTNEILHVDFLAVDDKTEITANLPLELEGEPAGVKAGGILEHMLHSLEVRCLPNDLPESLSSDVSDMAIGDILHIGDMNLPEGVSSTLADDVVVAIVAKTREAKSADAEDGDAPTEPEVTNEKSADE
ncbi:50S ribosomal protein L25 [Verrucomicrobiaceae bacterium R5-34]|uniref:Large ribosomal subunit protein bL25 n=1 Tax=Oceaniferula flava TaxID=2800421 RepID=A0AAE2SGM9_9BACT|nr:50S ribosomal protein L25 [Oceaniferula flavus]MBK1832298.1 50S ribosomal protein L25 [Verrucomicrobiaceae bacterium R5-34]MBK1856524.1 50S ribosomal protein L25 [Oceaniferula flavus]MBM1137831.1 50S ribosomal protein L25 [Oceaniferula flavus]